MDVCLLCLYVVFSCVGRGLCDGLITRQQESYLVSNCMWLRNPEKGGQRSVLDYKRLWEGGEKSVVNDNNNWWLVYKNCARRDFQQEEYSFGLREERVNHPALTPSSETSKLRSQSEVMFGALPETEIRPLLRSGCPVAVSCLWSLSSQIIYEHFIVSSNLLTATWDFKFSGRRVWSSESSGMYCRVLNWM
jgi:hypothetical protein